MIRIDLDRQPPRYAPADEIKGTVRWSDLEGVQSLEIRLIWFTQGKGDSDVATALTASVDQVPNEGQHAFAFVAPPAPYSFSGKLISLVWAIETIAFPEREAEHVEVTIAPDGKEVLISEAQGAVG